MEYATITSKYCCGIDLHARTMYLCVMDSAGKIQFHRNLRNEFSLLTQALKPYRDRVSIGVESTYNWYWIADGCHQAGIPFYLGHALYMKAIHGGKKKNDRIDSRTLADLMRSNFFPLAYAYPAYSGEIGHSVRRKAAAWSGGNRPCIPDQSGQSIRWLSLCHAWSRLAPRSRSEATLGCGGVGPIQRVDGPWL